MLCEIIDAVEKGLSALSPSNKYGLGGIKNKGIIMREQKLEQERIDAQK